MKPTQALEPEHSEHEKIVNMMMIGGLHFSRRIAEVLNAESLRKLIDWADTGGYREFGYTNMTDFLDQSPYAPMSRHEYHTGKELLKKETGPVYDQLNDFGISRGLRSRLPDGAVKVDGDQMIITSDKGETETLSLATANRTQIVETIKILIDSVSKQKQKIEIGTNEIRHWKEKALSPEDGNGDGSGKLSTLESVHTVAIGGLAALAAELEKASEAECLRYADASVRLLASQFTRLQKVLSKKIGIDSVAELDTTDDDDEDRLAGLLDD